MNNDQQLTPTAPAAVGLADNHLPELLQATVADYIDQLNDTPALCQTPKQQTRLVSLIADGKKLLKVIANERIKITKPLDEEKTYWIGKERSLTNQIEQAMIQLKLVVDDYNQQQMRLHLQEEADQRRQQQEEIDQKGEANWLTVAPPVTTRPKGVRQVWTHRIVEPGVVPTEFMTVDVAKVREAIGSGTRAIPGIEIYQETITTYRS